MTKTSSNDSIKSNASSNKPESINQEDITQAAYRDILTLIYHDDELVAIKDGNWVKISSWNAPDGKQRWMMKVGEVGDNKSFPWWSITWWICKGKSQEVVFVPSAECKKKAKKLTGGLAKQLLQKVKILAPKIDIE